MPKHGPLKRDMPCSVKGCPKLVGEHGCRGMCAAHARKEWARRTSYIPPEITKICDVEGCDRKAISNNSTYCASHQRQYREFGYITSAELRPVRDAIKDPLYKIWQAMRRRCDSPNNKAYKNYGGRGIKVCERWLGFQGFANFKNDMGGRPEGHSLDRIDVNGDYCPENCRWASRHTQNMNRRNNRPFPCIYNSKKTGEYRVCVYVPKIKRDINKAGFTTVHEAQQYLKQIEQEYGLC